MRTTPWFAATPIALVIGLSACGGESRPEVLWSFESASLSPDGTEIEIEAFGIPDPTCWEFEHVETEVDDDNLVVSLVYLAPEIDQFCNMPCPLGTETLTVSLDTTRDVELNIVKNPATEPHCAETLRPNSR